MDESGEGGDKNIEIAEKENSSADTKTKASQEELKNGKVDQSEGKPGVGDEPVVEDGNRKKQEENTSGPKEENHVNVSSKDPFSSLNFNVEPFYGCTFR